MAAKPLLLLSVTLATTAAAEVPTTVPVNSYHSLWANSPFTSKPEIPKQPPETDPLADYALGGVSPISGGYRVTLLNRRNPEERIILPENPHFKIVSVLYSAVDPLATTVRVSVDAKTGTVSFDEKLLTPKATPVTPQLVQPQNRPTAEGQRAPRPRITPPVTSGTP